VIDVGKDKTVNILILIGFAITTGCGLGDCNQATERRFQCT